MTLDARLAEAFARLPDYLGSHVLVSLTALALGLGISLPLAILRHRPWLRASLLAAASVVQTIPGLALLALFYPLLLALSALSERAFGKGFSALGFLPSVLALALYSMLPVLRNTVTGLNGVDPRLRDAARVIGMTPGQSLREIELPLALPVIMAGIRTAAVWVIGTATLATPIGQESLGNYIFTGLQTQNWVFVVFGCVAAAVLALAVDQLLALMQAGFGRRSGTRLALGALGIVAVTLAALVPGLTRPQATYVIGAKTFTEQYVLAALIKQRLDGGRAVGVAAPGARLQRAVRRAGRQRDRRRRGLFRHALGQPHAAQRRAAARERRWPSCRAGWRRRTASACWAGSDSKTPMRWRCRARRRRRSASARSPIWRAMPRELTIAGDYEFFARPEWAAIGKAYGLNFRAQRQMQPEFMYQAVADGEVDVISAYTSDGQIAAYDLVVLDDPRHAIPPYDAILLLSPRRANDAKLIAALKAADRRHPGRADARGQCARRQRRQQFGG